MPNSSTQSKVLILEENEACKQAIKIFCDQNSLLALTSTGENPLNVLKTNVDLSAIFISDTISSNGQKGLDLAASIHTLRPELPIFFRCSSKDFIEKFNGTFSNRGVCNAYHIDEISRLKQDLDIHIFNQHYPNALLRGIEEIARSSIDNFFTDVEVECSAPYLVKDRIIRGHLFSLIPIESNWCKGYMMLQTSQENIFALVDKNKASSKQNEDFRAINDILSEITNMIWGGIKNRFLSRDDTPSINFTQIPIIVNHENQYISFGTSCPHLCFNYTIRSKANPEVSLTLYHKFVFHITWDPDKFEESPMSVEDCLEAGELEFF